MNRLRLLSALVVAGLLDAVSRFVEGCELHRAVIGALVPSRGLNRRKHQEAERIQLA